jgi:shikimate kinase
MNLFLLGYRGCGKTTVAQCLATELGWSWCDADVELERRAGRSIKEIFATDGESAFRDLEAAVLADLAAGERQVVALGGGVVVRDTNRQLLLQQPAVVWLRALPETLWERIQADPTTAERRPNLTATGGLEEIRKLLAERNPWYQACSRGIVDTDGKSPAEIAKEVLGACSSILT